ncbi:hypothetical protein Lal_00019758 [Lupinus albus]|nr:hypothetical protein Lal_00019758 [Lupinus albus]
MTRPPLGSSTVQAPFPTYAMLPRHRNASYMLNTCKSNVVFGEQQKAEGKEAPSVKVACLALHKCAGGGNS